MKQRYERLWELIENFDSEPSTIKTLDEASAEVINLIKFLIENESFEEVDIISNTEVMIVQKIHKDNLI